MASSSAAPSNPLVASSVTEKLSKANHVLWKAQVRSAMRGARLLGHLTGATKAPAEEIIDKEGKKAPNPEFEEWEAKDQQILSFILASLGKDILAHVATAQTAHEVWRSIEAMFASQTRARVVNLRIALATTKKGNLSITDYYTKMKGFGDEMAAAGRPLDEGELVEYIITGLNSEFESLVSALVTRVEPIGMEELYSQMLNFETRMDLTYGGSDHSSANWAGRGGRGGAKGTGRGGWGRGFVSGRGRGGNQGSTNPRQGGGYPNKRQYNNKKPTPTCQVCFKKGHTAAECWHRFEEDYTPEEKHVAAAAMSTYGVDTNWYTDTGATDHVTGELEKLHVKDKYKGGDQIHTASGSGMGISHIGHTTVHTPSRNIHLNNVLYVPEAKKNLVSVHRLTTDNSVFLEFHPEFFLVKDQATKNTLLRGNCRKGLYPLPASMIPTIKQAHGVTKLPLSRWHSRLGHPSSFIVKQVVSRNNLPCLDMSSSESVCNACQQAKSHQLPYSRSLSESRFPLELVYSDVWGKAPESVGRKQYYVSFIDDYSKFTWIYLLRYKSEVFQKFHEFQAMVEKQFDRKILTMQTDWGVNIKHFILFLPRLVLCIMFPVLTPINKMGRPNESIVT